MDQPLITEQTFKGDDYTKIRLPRAEYECCIFRGCNFADGYLDSQIFMECEFVDCNLSNANLKFTSFREVAFSHCKMVGLKFEDCSDFLLEFTFEDCILNLSSFYQLKLKNQKFNDCKLIEVDFTETDLTNASFHQCDLDRAIFNLSILEKSDFRTVRNFTIDPENNRIKKAKFSKDGILGLIKKYDIIIEE